MSTAESGCGELGMVPSGVEKVGVPPPVPPVELVTSLPVVAPPALVFPPGETPSVEASPVVTALLPPEPVMAPALVELVEVTDTMPTVIVALLVDEEPGP